jgi:hypothetical protein
MKCPNMKHAKRVQKLAVPTQQRLTSYALAAAATGVSVLALTAPSEGEIVYKQTHQVIGNGDHFNLDITGAGTNLTIDNFLHKHCTTDGCTSTQFLNAKIASGNQVVHNVYGVVAMKPGMQIGSKNVWSGGLQNMAFNLGGFGTSGIGGSWVNVNDRYMGLKFTINGETHYGWARLNVHSSPPFNIVATLTGYAYETTPNKALIAGKTSRPEENGLESYASPMTRSKKSVSLGSLARGASGLALWRREEDTRA